MLPGLTREAEEQKLQEIIGIAQQNLERARADIRKVNEDLEDLLDVYEAQDKEGLALWNNAFFSPAPAIHELCHSVKLCGYDASVFCEAPVPGFI